jgi:hypothetical protein
MSISNCDCISSIGIKHSCEIIFDNPNEINFQELQTMPPNKVVYLNPDFFSLFKFILDKSIKTPIILVIGNSDFTFPTDYLTEKDFHIFIENPKIVHLFCQNCIIQHPKITKIPIALDYHTMTRPNKWGPILSPYEQEQDLKIIKHMVKPFWERKIKCYSNFHFLLTTKFGSKDRIDAMNSIPADLVFYEPTRIYRKPSWINQTEYSFVISPMGNGIDCHRTWEALCLGCIPIVKSNNLDELYVDLPVLIVSDWAEITQELLENTIKRFKSTEFNYAKLKLKYWMELIFFYK